MELNLGLDQMNGARGLEIPVVRNSLLGWWRHNEGSGDKLINFINGNQANINALRGRYGL